MLRIIHRQRFILLLLVIAGIFAIVFPVLAANDVTPNSKSIKFSVCLQMTPLEMAKNSAMVQSSYTFLLKTANSISDLKLRNMVLDCLKNPAPTVMELYPSAAQKEVLKQKLVSAGYIKPETTCSQLLPPCSNPKVAPQPFFGAPGSVYMGHHSYPGGLAIHTTVNTKVVIGLFNAYADVFRFPMDKDVIIASELLHDIAKPWVFQWQDDYSSLPELTIAGTGAHHILGIAELIYRGLPANVIVAMACAHTPPDTADDEKQLVDYIKAASIIAGKDPVQLGLLAPNGQTVPLPRAQEGYITHLGDHDFVLTGPAAQAMIAELGNIAKEKYQMSEADLKTKRFNAFRNYIFSQVSAEYLDHVFVKEGKAGLTKVVQAMISMDK
jgi:hypothetical protein